MGNYQEKIRARKHNLWLQKKQVNELYAERIAAGMTPAQAATTPYRVEPPPRYEPYVVKDGDTIEAIAQQFNLSPGDVLDYNKDLRNLQTGMVIETRPPFNPNWREDYYRTQDRRNLNSWLAMTFYPLYIPNKKKNKTYIFGIPFDWNLDNPP